MESNCKAEDDLDAGWLEVKKKHRGSSKFSIQGLVGGFSNKGRSNFLRNRSSVNDRSGKSNAKQRSQHSKVRQDFSTHVMMGGENSNSLSKEADKAAGQEFAAHAPVDGEKSNCVLKQAEKAIHCLDKCVVDLDTELPKSPPARSTNFKESNDVTEKVKIVTQNEKLDIVPKIKWGDLEDDALVICRENLDKAEIKFGNLGDDNLVYKKLGNSNDLESCDPSCADPQEDKAVVTPADAELVGTVSSTLRNESFEENCREFNEISIVDEKMVTPNDSNNEEIHHKHVEPMNVDVKDVLDFNYPETENGLSTALDNKSEDGAVYISEVPVENEVTSIVVVGQHSVLPPVLTSDPEASGDASVGVVVEEQKGSQEDTVNMAFSKVQFMNAFEEGESSESKERFRQRLWCFLFENLNRAIDELYLLCELECDLDQMKEAVLVLEEAGFDFKELKSRVEGFENAKRSSAQPSVDGLLGNVKIDHRRPHALSWEVRRMTASPHRAEILSSSLEAFKKIQNERTSIRSVHDAKTLDPACANHVSNDFVGKSARRNDRTTNARESLIKSRKQSGLGQGNLNGEKRNMDGGRSSKSYSVQLMSSSTPDPNPSQVPLRDSTTPSLVAKSKREPHGSASESEKHLPKKEKILTESKAEKNPKYMDPLKRQIPLPDKEKEKRNTTSCKSMDAWKEKRNWEDILTSPLRISSRFSHSPGMSRRSVERARVLHDKLMSPEKKKKTALDLKKEAAEKHARAMRIRSELENERVQRLQRTSEKLNRVNEWQAVRTMKLREGMNARQQRSESRHEAYLAQVARRAGDESSKVNEVRFITSLNEENKKFMLRQKLHDSELRRAGKLQIIKTKQKEDLAREEAVLERRRLLQAEKLQRLAETQKKKEEAQVRREEDRKASSAAREARAIEQLRRKEVRAKAQQEEAELLAQKLAERLSESEQRRKFYLEQIRERAAMDFRDQSSPLLRRSSNKEGLGKSTSTSNVEDYQANSILGVGGSALGIGDTAQQPSLKRRIKKIRQRLMALKYEFPEVPISAESSGIGYRTLMGTARGKIGRWLQELQRLRQARKEGAASIGLIVSDMIKFFEGRETELHASRQAGLLDFIASALPASHTSRPEACQVTIYLLRLLRVVLSVPANRSYFLAQNLLPPIIPMLSAALENYIKIAASLNVPGNSNSLLSKTSIENFESVSEVLEGFLWTVTTIIGHICPDERQLQMLDGLLELVIAYQVIHRLRDLFALYDRPQVEGSPFPSSIILSLNLLAVLTSRPKTISSIDWGYFPTKTVSANESEETKLAESTDLHDSSSNITDGDQKVVTDRPLSDVPEEKPLNESCLLIKHEEPLSNARDPEKDLMDISVDLNHISGAPHKCLVEWQSKPSLAQKDVKSSTDIGSGRKKENIQDLKQPVTFLLSVIAETGLVSLPSLLTAVLLQANSRLSSEQASYVLPSNFEEVATGVLKVLNNLALLDITLMQKMLARPDLKMEFFHLMSFLLSHCTSKWKLAGDQVGLLLLESLLLLGYFALFHPGNQAVLRWGKSPTILHKVCDLPFVFFSDPELMPILAGTLVASCYGCEQNRGVVQQELSTDMLLSLLGSCRNGLLSVQSNPSLLDNPTMTTDSCEGNQAGTEPKMFQVDFPVRSRHYQRNTRVSLGKSGGTLGNSVRVSKSRNQKDGKATKTCEDWALKHNLPASETSSTFMLHSRFPSSFIDRAEEFFSAGITSVSDKV